MGNWKKGPQPAGWKTLCRPEIHNRALEVMRAISPFHFPIAFPDVFLRERSGFDVILGNPPWEEVKADEHEFWARHFPGYRGLTQRERVGLINDLRNERPDLVSAHAQEVAEARLVRQVLMTGLFQEWEVGIQIFTRLSAGGFGICPVREGGPVLFFQGLSLQRRGLRSFAKGFSLKESRRT